MRRKIKLEVATVIVLLFLATITSINGSNVNNDTITNTKTITLPNSDVVITLWSEQNENGQVLP